MSQSQNFRSFLRSNRWRSALPHATAITLLLTGLFYYWFAVADRYVVFLYGHLGATPFDESTRSRYWMSGLVACGALMVLDTLANWFTGRVAGLRFQQYLPPAWWRVWLLCLAPLALGIPAITMTFNQPTLKPADAVALVATTSIGLALALLPRSLAARCPRELVWLTLAGLGLVPTFLLLRAVELPSAGLAVNPQATLLALGSTLAGAIWIAFIAWLRPRQLSLELAVIKRTSGVFSSLKTWSAPVGEKSLPMSIGAPYGMNLFVAGLCLSYLLMPLVHHLFFVPPSFRYISTAANFFAMNGGTQLVSILVAAMLAMGSTWLQRRFQEPPARHLQPG